MQVYTLTNVLDPADAQDVATKQYVDIANKAFIFGEGRYMAISVGGRRLNDVGTPVENCQASNKFLRKILKQIRDGIFASTGKIHMNGNSITGLANPIEMLPLIKIMWITEER